MTTQAAKVIERFGGLSALARAIDPEMPVSVVQGWKERGVIPVRRQQQVLDAAKREGVPLSAEDLIGGLT